MDRETTTLVLLSYNEKGAVEQLLPMLPRALFDAVLAIDGGSTDGTLDVYAQHGLACLVQTVRGRGNAFRLAAERVDTDRVVFLSTDGNEDAADLPLMLRYLDEGYDVVIGGRFLLPGAGSDDSDDPWRIRRLGNIGYSAIVRCCWRSGVRDAINGYRAFRTAALRRLHLDAERHEVELQSTIRAAKLGMRIKEFATRERPRLAGTRKASAGTLILGWTLGRCLLREMRIGRRFEP